MCGAWWDDLVDTESYIQENGKIVSGVGRCEEQLTPCTTGQKAQTGRGQGEGPGHVCCLELAEFLS